MFEMTYRCKWIGDGAKTIREIAAKLREEADSLDKLADAGIEMPEEMEDDYAHFFTSDAAIAEKFGFVKAEVDEDEDAAIFAERG